MSDAQWGAGLFNPIREGSLVMPLLFKASEEVETSQAGGRAVLYNRETGGATILNPTGSLLWSRLTEWRTADQLATHLVEAHPGLEPAVGLRDTDAFLAQMIKAGLVVSQELSATAPHA